jgi:hypothetical protein
MTKTNIMPEGMEDFEDLFLAFLESEAKKEAEIKAKTKVIYHKIFDEMPRLDKINNFIQVGPWLDCIKEYLRNNPSTINELGIVDVYDLRRYINPFFIEELAHLYEFIDLNFDNLDLSDEDIELWNKSTMFWFVTKLWLATIGDTDCIVQKVSGQGKIFYFLVPLDDFIKTNRFAKDKLTKDELNKLDKQFKEFALKHKELKGNDNG